jgi:hypothetical protein
VVAVGAVAALALRGRVRPAEARLVAEPVEVEAMAA